MRNPLAVEIMVCFVLYIGNDPPFEERGELGMARTLDQGFHGTVSMLAEEG